jgi:cytochrome c biogenesis protein CcdA
MLGGAITGGVLGGIGEFAALAPWRPWLIGAAVTWAIGLGLRRRPRPLGRQWQVPRAWNQTMPPRRRYFLWGLLLGCGLVTPISYPAFLVLVSAELTAGPLLGSLAGAVFGATRQALALVPLLRRCTLAETAALLPRLRGPFRRLNTVVVAVGGLLLILVAWR